MVTWMLSRHRFLWHSGEETQKRLNTADVEGTEAWHSFKDYDGQGSMKLTDQSASPIIRRSIEWFFKAQGWKGDYVFHISTTV